MPHPYQLAADVANASAGLTGFIGPLGAAGLEYAGAPNHSAAPQALGVGLGGMAGAVAGAGAGGLIGGLGAGGLSYLTARGLGAGHRTAMSDAEAVAMFGAMGGAGVGSGLGGLYGGRYGRELTKQAAAEAHFVQELIKLAVAGARYTAAAFPAVTGPDSYSFDPTPQQQGAVTPQAQVLRRPAAPQQVQIPSKAFDHAPQAQMMRRAPNAAPRPVYTPPPSPYTLPDTDNYDDLVGHYDKVWWDNNNPHREKQLEEVAGKIRSSTIGDRAEEDLMNEYWRARNGGASPDQLDALERNILVSRSGGHMGNMSFNAASPHYGRQVLREQLDGMASNAAQAAQAAQAPRSAPAKTPALLNKFKTLVSGLF